PTQIYTLSLHDALPIYAPAYRRVLLKLSGEALLGEQSFGIDVNVARSVAEEIKQAHQLGIQIAVVVGGGNIFRGVSARKIFPPRSEEHTSELQSQSKLV